MISPPPDRRAVPEGMTLGTRSAADGWELRDFAWPAGDGAKPRGSLLFLNGRGDFIEKYLEAFHHWHGRGWTLAGFDWRGQGGSGRLPPGPRKGDAAFELLVNDAGDFVRAWRETSPPPYVLVGHSMGGHLALRLLARGTVAVDAAVLIAPMLGLNSAPLPGWLAQRIARAMCRLGLSDRAVWKDEGLSAAYAPDRQQRLTSSVARYEDELWWKQTNPAFALGPPTWGWMAGAYASMAQHGAPGVLERIAVPMLILGAERDRLVSSGAIRDAARRLPDARLVMFEEGAHELLRESDPVRRAALAAIDGFLDERAPLH